jgi:hypothetical protein
VRHVLKAVVSPIHALEAFKYHFRRVCERKFVEFLGSHCGRSADEIDAAYGQLNRHTPLWQEIARKMTVYANGYGQQMTRELPALYLIVKLLKPDCVVETGVASGASSTYILQALHDNHQGNLHSIDLPPDDLPDGRGSGWVVPQSLRSRWRLHIGDSRELLGPLLAELGRIDCFVHDSLHTYSHMLWELRTAWRHLRFKGLLLSHDVGANRAFFDFMKEQGISWAGYRVFHVLGGLCKYTQRVPRRSE